MSGSKIDGIVYAKICKSVLSTIRTSDRDSVFLLWYFVSSVSIMGNKRTKTFNIISALCEICKDLSIFVILRDALSELYKKYKLQNCKLFCYVLKNEISSCFNFETSKIVLSRYNSEIENTINSQEFATIEIDQSILGGFLVYKNHLKIDASLRSKLDDIINITDKYTQNYLTFNSNKL